MAGEKLHGTADGEGYTYNISTAQTGVAITPTINAGTAFALGANQTLLDDVSISPGNQNRVFGSTVIDGSTSGPATVANSSAAIAYIAAGEYAIKRVTTTVAGISNTTLRSGALQPGRIRAIKSRDSVRDTLVATAIRAGNWNIYTGTFSSAPSASTDGLGDVAGNASGGSDNAANPTQAVPGELVYRVSGRATGGGSAGDGAFQDDYERKNQF